SLTTKHKPATITYFLSMAFESIKFAKNNGVQTILTNNEENNPMYLLNQNLGFQQKPAWINLEKSL
ncbi:MAG: hypothetical protein AAGD96_01040, partial [Chloroflexota bacterium]